MKAKRLLTLFAAILTALTLTVSFVGCGGDDEPGCNHIWTAATCTEPARCTLCNETNGNAAGHKYVTNTTAATCDIDGRKESECSVCHDKTAEVLPKLAHNYTSVVTEDATCEIDQVTTYTCKLCNEAYSEVTKRHTGHNLDGVTWTVDSEVEEDDECSFIVTEKAKCKTCKEDIERTYHKHVYKLRIVGGEPATCKDKGSITYGCACGDPQYEYTEELPKNPALHNWQSTNKAGATHECSVCQATKSEVAISGNSATIAASELSGKNNISIKTGNNVTLAPDAALAGKMASGVQIAAEPAELPSAVTGDDAKILEGAQVYNFELNNTAGNKIDFGTSKMTVSVPYEAEYGIDPSSVFACYIADDGKVEYIQAIYGEGTATFDAAHFSHYTVVRLTAEERCLKLGHNYAENVVPATCTVDGYTVKSCKRCGDFKREPGAKMTGHEYDSTVVAPTCTEKGYTLMACKHEGCDESYITKYTAALPHSYTDKKVAATCTVKGYTEHTCSKCGSSYRDSYTDTAAHKYSNGACTVCGKSNDASAADNFYINLVNSLSNSESYYADLSGLKLDVVSEFGDSTQTANIQIDAYRLLVGLDNDGYLVGSGEGKAKIITRSGDKAPDTSEQSITLAFKNKNIYMHISNIYAYSDNKSVFDQYSVTSQDKMNIGDVKKYIDMFYGDTAKKIKNTLLNGNAKNSPLNAGIAKVMDYLFDKKESAGGYTLTLNYDHAAEALEFANTHNAAEVFDAIAGDGKFDSIVEFAQGLPEMTLDEFILKAVDCLTDFGLKIGDIYDLIDSVFKAMNPNSTVNALDYVTKNGSKKVGAVVEELSGGKMTAAALKSQIDGFVKNYVPALKSKDMPFLKLAASFVPFGGEELDFAGFIKSSLDALNAAAKKAIGVVITTDNTGAFVSLAVKVKNLDYTQKIPAALVGSGNVDTPARATSSDSDVTATVKGDLTLVVTNIPGAINNNVDIVNTVDKAKADYIKAIKNSVGKQVDGYNDYYDSRKYTIASNGDMYVLVPYVDASMVSKYSYGEHIGEGEYNGEKCNVYRQDFGSSEILNIDGDYTYKKSCSGWSYNRISSDYVSYAYYKVYRKGAKVLGVELDWDKLKSLSDGEYTSGCYMYLNATQGKLALSDPHKYVKIKDGGEPTKCEETVCDTYRCTVCGDIQYRYRTKWHNYQRSFELKDKTKGCEGGVVQVTKCINEGCNYVERREIKGVDEKGNHNLYSIMHPINTGTTCTDTYVSVYGCVCGKTVREIYVGGGEHGCRFDDISHDYCMIEKDKLCEHGHREHYKITYQCYLSKCGYTYTEEYIKTVPNDKCVATRMWVYTLKDGTKYTKTEETTEHTITYKESTEGSLKVYSEVCEKCKKTVEVRKRDKYDREVYYYSYDNKSGWEVLYSADCTYVEYTLDENAQRGEQKGSGLGHYWTTKSIEEKHSCTQRHKGIRVCSACKKEETFDYFYGHRVEEGYHCSDCGIEVDVWARGPVELENLSKNGELRVGYHVRWMGLDTDVEFYINYNYGDGMPVEVQYNDASNNTEEASGIIVVGRGDVIELLQDDTVQTFTVVLVASEDYGEKEGNSYEMAITFTREELQQIIAE